MVQYGQADTDASAETIIKKAKQPRIESTEADSRQPGEEYGQVCEPRW